MESYVTVIGALPASLLIPFVAFAFRVKSAPFTTTFVAFESVIIAFDIGASIVNVPPVTDKVPLVDIALESLTATELTLKSVYLIFAVLPCALYIPLASLALTTNLLFLASNVPLFLTPVD